MFGCAGSGGEENGGGGDVLADRGVARRVRVTVAIAADGDAGAIVVLAQAGTVLVILRPAMAANATDGGESICPG